MFWKTKIRDNGKYWEILKFNFSMYFWKMSLYKKFVSGRTEWELIYKFLFCFLVIYVIKSTFRFHTLFCVFQGSVFCFFAFIIHSFKHWKRSTPTFFWSHSMLKNFEKFGFGGFIQTFWTLMRKSWFSPENLSSEFFYWNILKHIFYIITLKIAIFCLLCKCECRLVCSVLLNVLKVH